MTIGQGPSDIPALSWVDRYVPRGVRPYARLMRLDRPIGTWLLLLPAWWGLALATFGEPPFRLIILFLIGAVVMRGAGCTYNDIVDRGIDAQVARTRTRPLASKQIGPRAAWIFLAVLLAIGFAILLQFNRFAMVIGASSLVLVFSYPFMKRWTYWPQVWLGLAFNWGALTAWAAVQGNIDTPALLLYAAGFFWTLGYDTIYAHQDKEDDALVGVKSSALALGPRTKPFLVATYFVTMLILRFALRPLPLGLGTDALLGAAAVHLIWQVVTLKTDDPQNCLKRFRANRDFGLLVLAALLLLRF